ncbi:hypothetical protein NQ020_11060, partial [Corynebacterium sp. 1222RC1]|nr:hypothetical protein [Corynebacterium sp. 1222RC1]
QRATLVLTAAHVDVLLRGTDLLLRVGQPGTAGQVPRAEVDAVLAAFSAPEGAAAALAPAATTFADAEPAAEDATMKAAMALLNAEVAALSTPPAPPASPASPARAPEPSAPAPNRAPIGTTRDPHRMLRVRADNLDRLLSLSGESLVESRWLK